MTEAFRTVRYRSISFASQQLTFLYLYGDLNQTVSCQEPPGHAEFGESKAGSSIWIVQNNLALNATKVLQLN